MGKVIAQVHVIEFQKIGLPQAHILVIFDENDKKTTTENCDEIFSAEIPNPETQQALYAAVAKHMIHNPCGLLNRDAVCMREVVGTTDRTCKKNFPKQFAPITLQGNDSFPIYKRPENGRVVRVGRHDLDNRWVLPYNPYLLLKYDCHINVEICAAIACVKYLYKYVYKGPDRVSFGVTTRPYGGDDEISEFANARWICAPEAFWKIYKFPMNGMWPAVITLQLHLPNRQQVRYYSHEHIRSILDDEQRTRTMLTQFFTTNTTDQNASQYLYMDFP